MYTAFKFITNRLILHKRSPYYEKRSRYNEKRSRYNEKRSPYYEKRSRYYDIIEWKNIIWVAVLRHRNFSMSVHNFWTKSAMVCVLCSSVLKNKRE